MGRYRSGLIPWFVGRLLRLAVLLACVAVVSFALCKASPVDPVDAYLGVAVARVSPEQRALIAQRWGFDEPALTQLAKWGRNVLSGDLGESSIYAEPVASVLRDRFLASLALMAPAWLLSGALGFVLGVIAGGWADGWAECWWTCAWASRTWCC